MYAAVAIVVCQVVIMVLVAVFIRTFGSYTAAIVRVHESNTVLYQQSLKILEYANTLMEEQKTA